MLLISLLRARCSGAVYGNWDKLVLHGKDVERFGASYYRERLSAEDRAYLLSLPESLEIDFCGRSVLMYHGRFSIDCVVTPMFNNSRDNVEKALYRFGPHDITLMGDAHHPFMLTHQGRFLMNTGAVGNPCDRMPLASYLILRDENGVFSSEHVRVPYDLNRAVSIALHTPQLPMLETYINETVTAVYSRSYKPNTNTPQTNPWEELPLSVYHLQTGVLGLRKPLDKLLHNQLRDHPAKSYLLFGITDGSGLENAPLAHDTRIIGVDINEDYLRACARKLGHTPHPGEIYGSYLLTQRFSGWANAVSAAGLTNPVHQLSREQCRIYTDELCTQERMFKENREKDKAARKAANQEKAELAQQEEADRKAREKAEAEAEKQRLKEEEADKKRQQKLADEERKRQQKLEDEARRRQQKLADEERRKAERQQEKAEAEARRKAERRAAKIESQLISAGGQILKRGLMGVLKKR